MFCTWLTACCLKYFPVCSRINCSSGNDDDDDSSKKPKKKKKDAKKEKKRTEAETENWEGKQKSYRPKHVFVFDVFFFFRFYLFLLYFCLGQSSKNDENINKMLRPFATCMMISFSLIFVYFL